MGTVILFIVAMIGVAMMVKAPSLRDESQGLSLFGIGFVIFLAAMSILLA